jgi:hypothetical protein
VRALHVLELAEERGHGAVAPLELALKGLCGDLELRAELFRLAKAKRGMEASQGEGEGGEDNG